MALRFSLSNWMHFLWRLMASVLLEPFSFPPPPFGLLHLALRCSALQLTYDIPHAWPRRY